MQSCEHLCAQKQHKEKENSWYTPNLTPIEAKSRSWTSTIGPNEKFSNLHQVIENYERTRYVCGSSERRNRLFSTVRIIGTCLCVYMGRVLVGMKYLREGIISLACKDRSPLLLRGL